MNLPSVSAIVDRSHPKKDSTCSVSIRITFERKRRHYPTGIALPAPHFDKIISAKRLSVEDRNILDRIKDFEAKARKVINEMNIFTFNGFEKNYLRNRGAGSSVSHALGEYAQQLRSAGSISTGSNYECARRSFDEFRGDLRFSDITPELLQKYEKWMQERGKSLTTISMYVRCLRTIFNRADLDRSLYPFGNTARKYRIPVGRNVKKALPLDELKKILEYSPVEGSVMQRMKDYWVFVYYCNGLNIKDFCRLRYRDIDGNMVSFVRSKTRNTRKDSTKIEAGISIPMNEIIRRWGQASINSDSYIFPHLTPNLDPADERRIVQQLTRQINKYMKKVCKEVGITVPVTTYAARHSFATTLMKKGFPIAQISQALGHSDIRVTENYLHGFEKKALHLAANALQLQVDDVADSAASGH